MAEAVPTDRLQPCLLDRLTDDEPQVSGEGRGRRVVSLREYRQAVLRDLRHLLNSKARPPDDEIYDYEQASRSVVNFGLRDICGLTMTDLRAGQIESQVRRVLECFEPRISSESIAIRTQSDQAAGTRRSIAIEIEGRLWAQPAPEHLLVKTELDVETGHYEFGDRVDG